MQNLAADLNWGAQRLEDTNPDRSYEFSEGVDWAVAELRNLASEATLVPGTVSESAAHLTAFARRIVALDDVEGPGANERRTVTLNQIIGWARQALGDPA